MKKGTKGLAAVLAAVTLLGTLPAGAAAVKDINGHWAQSTIQSWIDSGRISGYPDGTFKPDNKVTRAEMVKLVNNAFGFTSGSSATFSDVKSDYWAYAEIQKGVGNGYISGNSDGTFQPDKPLTREQAAVMLAKVDNLKISSSETAFTDDASISSWAKPYVRAASLAEVMNGYPDNSFGPGKPLTRAEAVVAINKALSSRRSESSSNNNNNQNNNNNANKPTSSADNLTVDSSKKSYSGGTYNDIDIKVSGAKLKNITAEGDLTITGDVKNGSVTLEDVRVKGDIYVYGGGQNSIVFTDCQIDGDVVSDKSSSSGSEIVALKFDKDTSIKGNLRIQNDTTIAKNSSNPKISDVVIESKNLKVTIESSVTVSTLTLDSSATGTTLTVNGTISTLTPNSRSSATIKGSGTISKLESGKNSTITVTDKVTVENSTKVTGVSISPASASVAVDKTVDLTATVSPSDATNKTVTWSSNNTNIATVSDSGVVKGVKAGTATITAKANDGSGKSATCKITVTGSSSTVSVTGVTLTPTTLSLVEGNSEQLTATVAPTNASNPKVSWTSSDANIATVDANGKVTAVKNGNATITVKTNDGGKTAQCTVTVKSETDIVTKISLSASSLSLEKGETNTLTATVQATGNADKTVTWSSSDEKIATVAGGVVSAVAAGTATITATAGDQSATCIVTVKADEPPKAIPVEDVTLDTTSLNLSTSDENQQSAKLNAKFKPENATNKNVTWSSSDNEIATVDNGVVTAVSAGTATITVTTEDGEKTATCTVTVTE
ncbi:Ig-like domain-containing protein [Intestinibacillus massiliensis]|uniref:Ig-like domain-containing protein n=1 Tax=Intestinibacillus massiliensis TaxID=1871029 RepID=UPI000B358356|nr:Ig-like domain-containing protein [Intestinibacillus massiliensis]